MPNTNSFGGTLRKYIEAGRRDPYSPEFLTHLDLDPLTVEIVRHGMIAQAEGDPRRPFPRDLKRQLKERDDPKPALSDAQRREFAQICELFVKLQALGRALGHLAEIAPALAHEKQDELRSMGRVYAEQLAEAEKLLPRGLAYAKYYAALMEKGECCLRYFDAVDDATLSLEVDAVLLGLELADEE